MVTQICHLGVGGARWSSGCHGWIVFCVSCCVIVWRCWCFRLLWLSAHEQRRLFFLRFIFAVDQQLVCTSEFICTPERAGQVHTGGARAGNARAEAFVSCWVFFLGGVLLRIDHHDVGGMNNINHLELFRLKISRCQCTTYCNLRAFCMYVIPKVPTEFSVGISRYYKIPNRYNSSKNPLFVEKFSEAPDLPKQNKFWEFQKWFTKTFGSWLLPQFCWVCLNCQIYINIVQRIFIASSLPTTAIVVCNNSCENELFIPPTRDVLP